MIRRWNISWVWLALLWVAATGCRPVADAWMAGWTQGRANDRIMLVCETPRTLGYQRLVNQAGIYPDLADFLHHRGSPDFLAESTVAHSHFLILYYLDDRTAFACRAKDPGTRAVEFSSPYPITEREYVLLGKMRKDFHAAPKRQGGVSGLLREW